MSPCPAAHPEHGYSLIEILLVMGVMGLLLGLATPHWAGLQQRWAVRDLGQRYLSSLQWARSMAIQTGRSTTVCPSKDGHQCSTSGLEHGWIVLQGSAGQIQVLQDGAPSPVAGLRTHYGHRTLPIAFAPNGLVEGAGLRQILLCVPAQPQASLGLIINQTGRARWESAPSCP
jgi:type IV fimbrial biogenesis protein FimT